MSMSECIISQESKKDILFRAIVQGLRSLKESSEERRKVRETANTETIDGILNAADTSKAEDSHWHKSCYAKYTDKDKMSRLRKSLDSLNTLSPPVLTSSKALRSGTPPTDRKLCMFVKTEILEGAKCEHNLSLRLFDRCK